MAASSCRSLASYDPASSAADAAGEDASRPRLEAGADVAADGPTADGVPVDLTLPFDQAVDLPSGCAGWLPKPTHFDPCELGESTMGLVLSATGTWSYDTSDGKLQDASGQTSSPPSKLLKVQGIDVRVLSVAKLQIDAGVTLRVIGAHPLLVASWDRVVIHGAIDVSSKNNGSLGAGANPAACQAYAPTAGKSHPVDGGGGGGGGGFGGAGGDGGSGDGNAGGLKGTSIGPASLALRGGCSGASGGKTVLPAGTGGAGGGALQFTARASITIAGTLHAGGGGGGGGDAQSGGGGGGSGGYLGLEAPQVTLASGAVLAANGGGGGGGGIDYLKGKPGAPGPASDGQAVGGDSGKGASGRGGNGGHKATLAGATGVSSVDGGGGGGGGAGYLVLSGGTIDATGAILSGRLAQ